MISISEVPLNEPTPSGNQVAAEVTLSVPGGGLISDDLIVDVFATGGTAS